MTYQERFYRHKVLSRHRLEVGFKQSDLLICSNQEIDKAAAKDSLVRHYQSIAGYVQKNPAFLTALSPLPPDRQAPPIVTEMLKVSQLSGIGPFAAVAGAIALYVGNELLEYAQEVVVENGGDIFLQIKEDKGLGVYLGENFNPANITLNIKKRDSAFGIASSSATIGSSLNLGAADLVTVIAKNAILADSFATSLSNRIKKEADIEPVLTLAKESPFVEAIVIAFKGKIYLWGDLELTP